MTRPGWVRWPLLAAAALLVAASLLPEIPTDDWWIRALDFPRPQVGALLVLLAPALLLLRRGWLRRAALAGVLAALAVQLVRIRPYTPLHAVQVEAADGCPEGDRLSLVVANLRAGNSGAGSFLAEVRRAAPDVVLVVEVDPGWARALAPLEESHPHRLVHPREDYWGLALYSRPPLEAAEVRHLLSDYVPSLRARVRLGSGAAVELHGVHPRPPLPGEGTGQRDAELLLAARAAREGGVPAVVGGDLNAVAWSGVTRLVQRVGGLLDPRVGRGPMPTFPTWLPWPLRVPIDHVLFTPDFRLLAVERLPDVGSDHLPVLARLCRVPGAAPLPPPTASELRRAEDAIEDGREDAPGRRPRD